MHPVLRRFLVVLGLVLVSTRFTTISAQAAPRLLPFQGRLTDSQGRPIPDGLALAQFQIYADPAGGTPVWAGEIHRLTANGGLVNVVLGSKNPLPSDHPQDPDRDFFDSPLYLQITVDSNGDGKLTDADVPLAPRQAILPVVFASDAARARNADRLGGYAAADLPSGVPVGAVLMWWGTVSTLPVGFEVCDGTEPNTPGAKLTGPKPDLRDRFPKGATSEVTDVKTNPRSGGANEIGARATLPTALAVQHLPQHFHSVNLTASGGAHRHKIVTGEGDGGKRDKPADGETDAFNSTAFTETDGAHVHSVVGNTGAAGEGAAHTHGIPAQDNRPAFLELLFIIRVK